MKLIKLSDIEYFDYEIPYMWSDYYNSYIHTFSRSKNIYPCQPSWSSGVNEIVFLFGKIEPYPGNKTKRWAPSEPRIEYLCCHKENLDNVINMPKDSLNVDYIDNHLSEYYIENVFASIDDMNKFLLMQ